MKKFNFKTREYEPYEVPDDWFCPIFANDLDEKINCSSCGKIITFGDGYSSRCVHTDSGLGYCVCLECYEAEVIAEKDSIRY